eukprot:1315460-Amorphochlora_amoeboformis.AAC.1
MEGSRAEVTARGNDRNSDGDDVDDDVKALGRQYVELHSGSEASSLSMFGRSILGVRNQLRGRSRRFFGDPHVDIISEAVE